MLRDVLSAQARFHRPSWCEVDLKAVDYNTSQLKELIGEGVKLFVCLKGNALNFGAERVAASCQRSGADGFTFGNIDTAIACRRAGITLPILLYPNCLPESALVLEQYCLTPTISSLQDVDLWDGRARSSLDVFLKIDSGGLRAGALPQDAIRVAEAITSTKKLRLAGVYGHSLASYHTDTDDPKKLGPSEQIEIFLSVVRNLEIAGINVPIRMVSSSEVVLSHPDADLNAVDPGRLIFGIDFPAIPQRKRLWKPALSAIKTRIVTKKRLDLTFASKQRLHFPLRDDMVIGLLPFGWTDGYPRELPRAATALVRGQRVSLLGPVHSELLRIDLTDVPDAEVGDEVVLMGVSGSEEISIQELAQQWEISLTELYATIGKTLPKIYLDNH